MAERERGALEKNRNTDKNVVKLHQDVKTRWDSTSRMLIRAIRLEESINLFCQDEGPDWLKFRKVDWDQVKYLADLTKPFAAFTQRIGQTRTPSIHHTFAIYNRLFDHLDYTRSTLRLKRKDWKRLLITGIDAGEKKLRKYYSKTKGSLGNLFGIATLLAPCYKNQFFDSITWTEENPNSRQTWGDLYWEKLEQLYNRRYKDITVLAPIQRPIARSKNTDGLGVLLTGNRSLRLDNSSDELSAWHNLRMCL